MNVINKNGYSLDFDSAVEYMDDEIREMVHSEHAPCSEQEFFTAYENAHLDELNEEWELSKANPTW